MPSALLAAGLAEMIPRKSAHTGGRYILVTSGRGHVAIHPGMVEDLAAGTRDLYAEAEARLLGIIARQLADGLDAPGWAERKLAAVQQLRRAAQGVVDELGKAVTLEVFDVVAEAYNEGHRAAVAELGALSDGALALVDDVTPNAQAVDRLAQETVDVVTSTHRSPSSTALGRSSPRSPQRLSSAPAPAVRRRRMPCAGSPTRAFGRSPTARAAVGS